MSISLALFGITELSSLSKVNDMSSWYNVISWIFFYHLSDSLTICSIEQSLSELLVAKDWLIRVSRVDGDMSYRVSWCIQNSRILFVL